MKIISLNSWSGKVFEPLMDFVEKSAKDTQVFCFQEVSITKTDQKERYGFRLNLLADLAKVLPDYEAYFVSRLDGMAEDSAGGRRVDFDLHVGNAIFVHHSLQILDHGDQLIDSGNQQGELGYQISDEYLQYVKLKINDSELMIGNFQGTYFPGDKLDTPKRLKQSQEIVKFISGQSSEIILAGDFNLMPETISVQMLEKKLRNLIKEFDIKDTRGKLNKYIGTPDQQFFADYTFVSSAVKVVDFQVPDLGLSDHMPMILEFEI